jgi:AraC-like DNA-binding protein
LQRRLQEEDTSFRSILNDRQFALAKRYFNDSALSIGQVAFKVGFSDHAAFTRAFKRWSGVSPKDYKGSSIEQL